jgi:hypothetical protein
MRRLSSILFVGVVLAMAPSPAYAWWEKIDPFSGPGPFSGFSVEARIFCFNQTLPKKINPATNREEVDGVDDLQKKNFTGLTLSACPIHPGEVRRASIDLGLRLLKYADSKNSTNCAEGRAAATQWAGCNTMSMVTLVPTLSWRVFANPRHDWLDFVDLSFGGGVYWFSSDGSKPGGFDSFAGIILEPGRIDIHAPTALTKGKGGWAWAIPAVRFGLAVFPAGFQPNAFGPQLVGEKAGRIGAEWRHTIAIFGDLEAIVRRFSN